jgi:hypothetical protein
MKQEQLNELMYQALETEMGGVQIYTTALRCVLNDELKEEWEKYLEQTRNHVQIVQGRSSHWRVTHQSDGDGFGSRRTGSRTVGRR